VPAATDVFDSKISDVVRGRHRTRTASDDCLPLFSSMPVSTSSALKTVQQSQPSTALVIVIDDQLFQSNAFAVNLIMFYQMFSIIGHWPHIVQGRTKKTGCINIGVSELFNWITFAYVVLLILNSLKIYSAVGIAILCVSVTLGSGIMEPI